MKWSHTWLTLLICNAVLSKICAADDWSITTADFQTQPVLLQSVSNDGVGVISSDSSSPHIIGLDDFVSLHRTNSDEPQSATYTLTLLNGDRLVGTPGSVVHEKLSWNSPSLGVMPIPLSRIARLSKGLNVSPLGEAPKQDMVTLSNGDTVAGVFVDCADSKLTLQTDAATSIIPLDTIKQIAFAATGVSGPNNAHRFRLRLVDGSLITTADAVIAGDQVNITLPGKEVTRITLPLTKLVGIEQINGPVCWLSSCDPTQQVQVPYLAGASEWPARFDLAVDGSPLSFEGQVYDHGIGVHAFSRITFAIDPQWKFFRTQYAIDSNRSQDRRYADVTVRVLLDDKVVHELSDLREGILSPVLMLDIQSARTLTLECDYGANGDTQAHLDWLQAAFIRQIPQPATAPTSAPATSQSVDH